MLCVETADSNHKLYFNLEYKTFLISQDKTPDVLKRRRP
jgi:hypothetical protein